jgi:hypothetical protein
MATGEGEGSSGAWGSGLCTGVLLVSDPRRFLSARIGGSGCCIEPADASPGKPSVLPWHHFCSGGALPEADAVEDAVRHVQ